MDRSTPSDRQLASGYDTARERHAVARSNVTPGDRSFGSDRRLSYSYGPSHPSGSAYHGRPAPAHRAFYDYGHGGGHRYYGPAYGYRSGHYRPWLLPSYRPYYHFRPRFSIGFGISVGYPVAFSAWYGYGPRYGYPAAYAYPLPRYYAYPVPRYGPGGVYATYGGMSFEIDPPYTEVYVDGQYLGTTATYSATAQPLLLAPGRHRVELQAQGFQPVVIDLDVVPGQIIPYRGSLVPY